MNDIEIQHRKIIDVNVNLYNKANRVKWKDGNIYDRFTTICMKYRKKTAIIYGIQRINYEELLEMVECASRKVSNVINSNKGTIALVMESRLNILVYIFAMIKLGLSYVVIEKDVPLKRISKTLKLISPVMTLVDSDIWTNRIRVKSIHKIRDKKNNKIIKENNSKCVLFTSGSSGKPKGVIHEEESIYKYAEFYSQYMNVNSESKLISLFSLTFAGSLADIFSSLLNGATLKLYKMKQKSVKQLAKAIICDGITHYHSVPALWRYLSEELIKNSTSGKLKIIDLAGDLLKYEDINKFMTTYPEVTVVNRYSSTELLLVSLYMMRGTQSTLGNKLVPLGPPIKDVLCKTDENMVLSVKSPTQFIGYWGKNISNKKWYNTGDVAKIIKGNLMSVGRFDKRVKVRGNAVDLSEIENEISKLSKIDDVKASKLNIGDNEIIQIEMKDAGKFAKMINDEFKNKFPDYMRPTQIINKNKMMKINSLKNKSNTEYSIIKIVMDILGREDVHVDDNLFDIGANSLSVNKIYDKLNDAGYNLELLDIYKNPTINKIINKIGN